MKKTFFDYNVFCIEHNLKPSYKTSLDKYRSSKDLIAVQVFKNRYKAN